MNTALQPIRIVVLGHVDHGKSTVIGRLFHDAGLLPEGRIEQLHRAATRRGMPFEWANLMDGLQAERDQNITIDSAQIWMRTPDREYVFIDAPGHKEFLKNMVTGAASADAALLVLDAGEGVQEQTRRHGYLLHLLGIRQVIVAVNKMDAIGYSRERFESLVELFGSHLGRIGLHGIRFLPIAAREGENIVRRSSCLSWWDGPTLLEALAAFTPPPSPQGQGARFVVQDVYRFDHRRIVAGRLESGTVRVGDELLFTPGHKTSRIATIERWQAPPNPEATEGESIGLTFTEPVFIERGCIGSPPSDPPIELPWFRARIFWLGHTPLQKGRRYRVKLATQDIDCEVESIHNILNASTLETVARSPEMPHVERHEVADVTLRTRSPMAFDIHGERVSTARFVLVDDLDLAGGGIILDSGYPRRTSNPGHKSSNIYWTEGMVTRQERDGRNGHPGRVVWLTGLSASGKSTLAVELERQLFKKGRQVYVLDGDKVRHGLCSDLGFAPADRAENIRRVGEVAKLFADSGAVIITAFISPYRADRSLVRSMLAPGDFLEVFVDAPLEICESRDPKGLYARARAGEIKEFTGVSAPYEPPDAPELTVRTDLLTVEACVERVLAYLDSNANDRQP